MLCSIFAIHNNNRGHYYYISKDSIAGINRGWVLLSINLKVSTFLQEFWCPDTILKQELF